jgi:glycosyltransferase involved in cell wall biosynthesis
VKEKKRLLMIVPDLELNGAQTVLYELASLPFFAAYSIDMIAPTDGLFHERYQEMGIHVQIRPHVAGDRSFREHMQTDYYAVFINSSSCSPYLFYFFNTSVPVYWWLHETHTQLEHTGSQIPDPRLYSENIHLLGVTTAVREAVAAKWPGTDATILPMPIADRRYDVSPSESQELFDIMRQTEKRTVFFLPAGYTVIKGQDILLDAVSRLPREYGDRAYFILCGYKLPKQEDYYRSLRRITEKMSNVTMLDELSREDVYRLYRRADCVLAPSRVDATPTSIVEAAMFEKLIIVSDAAGISRYLQDCVSAFVFSSENTEELMKRILLVIADHQKLDSIASSARKVYEDHFSPAHVTEVLQSLFE